MSWLMVGLIAFVLIVVVSTIHDRVELSEDESNVIRRMIDKG